MGTVFRYCLFALGIFLGLPLLAVFFLMLGLPISFSGILYLAGCFLIVFGLVSVPWQPRYALTFFLMGSAILGITIAARIFFPPSGSQMTLITLPGPSGPRLLNRLFDEQDMVLLGAKIAPSVGFISTREYSSLVPALRATFQKMHARQVTTLSPAITTYLGLQNPNQFDALVAEPPSETSGIGIIFLHGSGGNFTLQCWLIAEAGNHIGAVTLCPSTDPGGQWWNDKGTDILQESLAYFHQRRIRRIYLAGLSNGAIGASRLADRYKSELAGLILISGADPGAKRTGLPALVLHGQYDERIPASITKEYAIRPNSTYLLFEGDHLLLLKEADQVQAAIADWLIAQENR